MTSHSEVVLIVDDDVDIRETIAEVLEDEGYRPQQAANGEEALNYLRRAPSPCMILLDLMMPVMDGFRFRELQQAEARLASIPVVVISAGGSCAESAKQMGAAGCVKKPFKVEDLLAAVERVC